ncbi:MAG: cupin domain-containing protein [Paracoccaceae bacterium]|jgi:quercetin dioxygenase-like cupin family protein
MINVDDIGGQIVKCDERYVVKDNTQLNNLVLSSTDLHPRKSTSGHSHPGQEEVYQFVRGDGIMQLDEEKRLVKAGDIVLVPDGVFHKVHAGELGCYFICIFDGRRHER